MKKIIFILLLITASTFAQKKINNYKYVIVPNKFEFVKKNDQYQTSSLTKFLFNKSGFTTFLADESLPKEVAKNRCLALIGSVRDDSGMFTTKSIVELRDCNNKVVFTSKEGKSKIKEYKKAYHEAIRNAFKSVKALNYKYNESSSEKVIENKEALATTIVSKPKLIKAVVIEKVKEEAKTILPILYAQPTNLGFQLVDTSPKVVFRTLKTNVKDVYILKDKNGILFKNGNNWVVEYYNGENKIIEEFKIKF